MEYTIIWPKTKQYHANFTCHNDNNYLYIVFKFCFQIVFRTRTKNFNTMKGLSKYFLVGFSIVQAVQVTLAGKQAAYNVNLISQLS